MENTEFRNAKILAKNALLTVFGITPLGVIYDTLTDSYKEICEIEEAKQREQQQKELLEQQELRDKVQSERIDELLDAKKQLILMFRELTERLEFVEMHSDTATEEVDIEFSDYLTDDQYKKFVELFSDSDIPIGTNGETGAEMYADFDGIVLHLDEKLTGYEIQKVKEAMDELLKEIDPELSVIME